MELARAIRALAKRPWLVAVGVLIAAAAALFSTYTLSGGKLRARSLQYSAASTQVIVDAERSVLGSVTQSFEPLSQRAWVYANFMTSPTFLDDVGQHVGLSGARLYAAGPLTINEPRIEQEPTELKRNVEITGETKPYRLSYEAQTGLPTITINSQAPTTDQAVALANSAAAGLQSYVSHSELTDGIPRNSRVVIRQLGPASGAVVDGGISKALAFLVFVGVFLLWCALVLYGGRFRQVWREKRHLGGGVGRRVERSGRQARDRRTCARSTRHLCAASREPSVRRHPGKRRRQCRRRGPSAENQVVSTLCAASKRRP